jgi:hypothetical protein
MTLSIDDAIALFVQKLRTAPALSATYNPHARHTTEGCDVRVTDVLSDWWHREHRNELAMPHPGEEDYAPFHDAAWELARRGILRPGPAFPGLRRVIGVTHTESNGFSLTEIGRKWISQYDQEVPFPVDPGRFATLLISYGNRFGPAFKQRITEANGCYRTLNYLAACAMAGAACESILLAMGSAKIGEEKALRIYTGRDGRRLLIKEITANLSSSLRQPVETAASVLSYWRDDAAHGHATEITEFSAHDALSRLLRFAQFVDRNWNQVTANSPPSLP